MPNPLPNYKPIYAWINNTQAQITPTHDAKPRVGADERVDFDELSLELVSDNNFRIRGMDIGFMLMMSNI